MLATLERLHLATNTLVIVTSDNGGMMNDGYATNDEAAASGHRCNGPLRGFKGSLWEGGHREPFIARWPGKIRPGSVSGQLIGLVDMLATFCAIAGQPVPAGAGPDSYNVLPAFLGGKSPRDHLVVQNNGVKQQALRQGAWKFIPSPPGQGKGVGLFELTTDLGETNNLAAAQPERVTAMAARLERLREESQSRP